MDIYRLTPESTYIHPRWLNANPHGRVAVQNNGVTLNGERLLLRGKVVQQGWQQKFEPVVLADGTLVEVWLNTQGFFVCALAAEVDREAAEKRAKNEAVAAERERKKAERIAAARDFNDSLAIPVRWTPGIKDVLSGLTENSWGDGTNARTVVHILLEEPVSEGKFVRNKGDFLCTTKSGTNGKQWSTQTREHSAQVTCKACLKTAQRWQRGH